MAELGKVVPILPIVTKSDSMTIREAATYRREVYRKLQNPQLPEPQGHYPTHLCTHEACSHILCTLKTTVPNIRHHAHIARKDI